MLSEEADLAHVARCTERFSGADLKALLCNAQLHAVQTSRASAPQASLSERKKAHVRHYFPEWGTGRTSAFDADVVDPEFEPRVMERAAKGGGVLVRTVDLEAAIAGTKRSISERERERFELM